MTSEVEQTGRMREDSGGRKRDFWNGYGLVVLSWKEMDKRVDGLRNGDDDIDDGWRWWTWKRAIAFAAAMAMAMSLSAPVCVCRLLFLSLPPTSSVSLQG